MQLDDLSDDCLMAMLERLPPKLLVKSRRLNRRFDRLATIKMRVKINSIKLQEEDTPFNDCPHLGAVSSDQELALFSMFNDVILRHLDESRGNFFLSLLSKCAGVKSVDFSCCELPVGFPLEVVRCFPELECVKINSLTVDEDEWDGILDQIGQKIIHIVKKWQIEAPVYLSEAKFLETVAGKCPNIKQLDLYLERDLAKSFVKAFKKLPNNCWIRINCDWLDGDVFEDAVDELALHVLDWSKFGGRFERLSKLNFEKFEPEFPGEGPIRGVDFVGIKKLNFSGFSTYKKESFDYLIASRFPRLEKFVFNPCAGLDEDVYDRLFRRMTSVKKLTMICMIMKPDSLSLPQSAIHHLEKLDIIDFKIRYVNKDWQLTGFLKQLEEYVDEIKSLKKLTVKFDMFCRLNEDGTHMLESKINRIKMKQNRVLVDVIYKN